MWRAHFGSRWRLTANYSYLLGRDLNTNRRIRRLPTQQGEVALRYGRRWWVEGAVRASGGDIDDERIGGFRRRSDIADFFNGARAPRIGKTLLQIQNRVLPGVVDSVRVPLYSNTPGWTTVELRGMLPLGERWTVYGGLSTLADRNFRIHGSGVDAPGRNASLGARLTY